MKPKVNGRKEIVKIRVEDNEIENRKTIEKISETQIWLFEKIHKIDKPLTTNEAKEKKQKQRI